MDSRNADAGHRSMRIQLEKDSFSSVLHGNTQIGRTLRAYMGLRGDFAGSDREQ